MGSRIPMSTMVPALCLRGRLAVFGRQVLTGVSRLFIMRRSWWSRMAFIFMPAAFIFKIVLFSSRSLVSSPR